MEDGVQSVVEVQPEIQVQAPAKELKKPTGRKRGKPAKKHYAKPDVSPAAPRPAMKIQEDETITFFTESDLDSKGRIKHTYPMWSEAKARDDIEEEIRRIRYGLDNKLFNSGVMGEMREKLNKAEKALDEFDSRKPDFTRHKDTIAGMVKELSEDISAAMYTRSDEHKGVVNAHEEARRMVEPVIRLSPRVAAIAEKNGIKVDGDRKVSRNDATRLWQLGRSVLGEGINPEILRRD